jgi:hypothetical protein
VRLKNREKQYFWNLCFEKSCVEIPDSPRCQRVRKQIGELNIYYFCYNKKLFKAMTVKKMGGNPTLLVFKTS